MARVNDQVADLLRELTTLVEIEEGSPQAFRVRAYQNGERAVRRLQRDVTGMSASQLAGVKGIGSSIAAKIREYVDTGTIARLDELRARHPAGQLELMRVPGLGARTIELLRDQLDVTDLQGLLGAIEDGRLRDLPGMGERSEANLKRAIERLDLGGEADQRVPIAVAMPIAEALVERLRGLPAVERIEIAGSLRRFRDTIGDIDLLVASDAPGPIMSAFVDAPEVDEILGQGDTKSSVISRSGSRRTQIDLRVVPPDSFGAALVYFTGSKAHNIRLRERSLRRQLTLNEYALAHLVEDDEGNQTAGEAVAGRTEEDVYARLDLSWIPPELREDGGEIEAAESGELPELVELDDVRGDLHDHSDWSGDGRATMQAMVAGAAERGLEYFALTDHAENLTINGIDRVAMRRQRRELSELGEAHPDLTLLHGAELNIGVDGRLDYDDEFLATFDWCVASVHSSFNRDVAEQTARVVAAIRHPAVNAIGHLAGRRIGKRPGIELDLERVFDAAVETGTAIEVNANLDRLDASADVIREGAAQGVTFVISTDAHSVAELDNATYGVRNARRGGLPRDRVANTWPTARFLDWVAEVRRGT